MRISNKALHELLRATGKTADQELTCDESGELVHRYVEFRVTGSGELPEELRGVEQHLSVCRDCVEVVEAVIAAIREENKSS